MVDLTDGHGQSSCQLSVHAAAGAEKTSKAFKEAQWRAAESSAVSASTGLSTAAVDSWTGQWRDICRNVA